MSENEKLTFVEQIALNLTEAALYLDQSRVGLNSPMLMAKALENNMQVWVELGVLVKGSECQLPAGTRDNLLQLRDFVTDTTMKDGVAVTESIVNTMVNINFQISEGLLESEKNKNS